jgi:molybdopterin biosynthesis enzyme MoaB
MSKVSEDWQRFSFGIITVSDRCHKGQSVDESGPEIKQMLQKLSASKIFQVTVPDEIEEISVCNLKFYL